MNKRMIICLFLFILLATSLPGSATAQGNQPPPAEELEWVFTGGPRGGIGYDLRIHPENSDIIWVTDAFAGTHQSTDGGQTWIARNEGIDARTGMSGDAIPIFSLTIDPNNPDIMYAGTMGTRGVFKTTDGGQAWERKDNGIRDQPEMEVRGFTIDPNDSNVVYCAGNYLANQATMDQRGFIYKTTDGGEHWDLLIEPDALVRWVIVDPTDSNIVYASTGIFDRLAVKPTGVLKSSDGGQTWDQINNGFDSLAVAALAMHPENPLTLIAGTGKSPAFVDEPNEVYGGVFLTHDGGQTWYQVDPMKADKNQRNWFSAVAFAPSDPDIVYADTGRYFLRSEDGGESWDVFQSAPSLSAGFLDNRGQPIALVVHPKDPDTIFVNAYAGGVFLSTDGGRSWQDSSKGYTGLKVWGLALDPENPAYVFVASKNGTYLSYDAGHTWHGRITETGLGDIEVVSIDPTDRNHVLVARNIDGQIFQTKSGGFTWSLVLGPFGEDADRRSIHAVEFAPGAPEIVYAATGIATLESNVSKNTTGPGVYKSLDGGDTWEAVNNGLENTTMNIGSLVIHPENPEIVFIGEMNSGVHKTIDGGQTWALSSSGLIEQDIRTLAINPQNPEILYAGTESGGVWKSEDSGGSWENASGGMPPEATIHSIVIDPTQPEILYAADMRSGVYRSTDSGTSWQQLNNGLEIRSVHDLVISGDGGTLYAATDGNGVYRLDIDGQPPEALPEITIAEFLGIGDSPFNVDGLADDWEGCEIAIDEPTGDSTEGYLDLSTGYIFNDGTSIYFLVGLADPKASFVQIDIQIYSETQTFGCSVSLGSEVAYCQDYSDRGEPIDLGQTNYSSFKIGDAFEGRLDFRDLGSPVSLQLTEIVVYAGECCEENWIAVDDWWLDGGDPPGSGMSTESVVDELSGILIDGLGEDWAERSMLVDDPLGDSEDGFIDIVNSYAFINDEALLFLIEFADPSADFVQFDLVLESGSKRYNCSVDPGSSQAWCGDVTGGGWEDVGSTEFSHFVIGEALEGRFDLREFGATEGYQLKEITVMVGECCDYPNWHPADMLTFNGLVPKE